MMHDIENNLNHFVVNVTDGFFRFARSDLNILSVITVDTTNIKQLPIHSTNGWTSSDMIGDDGKT